ncbi:MAG: prepilin-type N-terminal cleavage/methylation domain-containing protein [Sumerlaeia bacterium]
MKKAFTLIELLIVVAIIAILAAIAVPNFLEAQTRSKVSRAKSDMRTLDTGLMVYFIDNNAFPKANNFSLIGRRFNPNEQALPERQVLERLSTPIAYVTNSFIQDPFEARFRTGAPNTTTGEFTLNNPGNAYNPTTDANFPLARFYSYSTPGLRGANPTGGLQDVENATEKANYFFTLASASPVAHVYNLGNLYNPAATEAAVMNNMYDPTNGTVSVGGIFRVNGVSTGPGNYGGTFFDVATRVQGK